MKRNEFIGKALAGTAALFAVKWGTFAQIREYKQPDKPLLTAANLTRFFSKSTEVKNDIPYDAIAKDPKVFLEENFSISPQQRAIIGRITDADWQNTNNIIAEVRKKKGRANFKFLEVADQDGCETQIRLVKTRVSKGIQNEVLLKEVVIQSY